MHLLTSIGKLNGTIVNFTQDSKSSTPVTDLINHVRQTLVTDIETTNIYNPIFTIIEEEENDVEIYKRALNLNKPVLTLPKILEALKRIQEVTDSWISENL